MNIEEYNEQQQTLTAAFVALMLRVIWPFRAPALNEYGWTSLLRALYPEVEKNRTESARLGRRFYDSERRKHIGERFDINLASYRFEWFEEAMRPVKRDIQKSGTSDDAVSRAVMRAVKEIENGGRRTIMRPIRDEEVRDPQVKGWARVATGRETCGFCLMMVSRGPVYLSAETAGLDLDDTSALEAIEEGDGEAIAEAMTRWHPGCDCKVVPVFDRKNWPGRDAYLQADRMWREATKGYSGKEALNALRRALNSGEVAPENFAAAA